MNSDRNTHLKLYQFILENYIETILNICFGKSCVTHVITRWWIFLFFYLGPLVQIVNNIIPHFLPLSETKTVPSCRSPPGSTSPEEAVRTHPLYHSRINLPFQRMEESSSKGTATQKDISHQTRRETTGRRWHTGQSRHSALGTREDESLRGVHISL